ncbi:MAG TPA: DUF1385 domain-containing protein [Thermoleophilaceae bacterium]|nr:DUF1385 domain-containing protein [Thermoleophilaceae bacterium]
MSEEKLRLGGMALRNGLLVHGPTHWAAAVRTRDGRIEVASGRKPSVGDRLGGLPGVRGVAKLGEALALIPVVKRRLPAAELPMQDVRTLAAMAGAGLATRAIRGARGRTAAAETAVALIGVVPALLALRGGDLAAWHGVEHKSIAAYEQDGEAADAEKEHDRCGSNLVAPMLAGTVVGNVAARRAGLEGRTAEVAVAVGSMALAVEVFGWSERHAGSALSRALRRPGFELQRALGTREPTDEQLEVGKAALDAILTAEGVPC